MRLRATGEHPIDEKSPTNRSQNCISVGHEDLLEMWCVITHNLGGLRYVTTRKVLPTS